MVNARGASCERHATRRDNNTIHRCISLNKYENLPSGVATVPPEDNDLWVNVQQLWDGLDDDGEEIPFEDIIFDL